MRFFLIILLLGFDALSGGKGLLATNPIQEEEIQEKDTKKVSLKFDPNRELYYFQDDSLNDRQSTQERLEKFEKQDYTPVKESRWSPYVIPTIGIGSVSIGVSAVCNYAGTPCWDLTTQTVSDFYYKYPYITVPALFISGILMRHNIYSIASSAYTKYFASRESLIKPGIDRRNNVPNTFEWPNRVHGYMEMLFGTKTYVGSGTLIGNQYILTAGHNLMDEKTEMANEVRFYPGRNGSKRMKLPNNLKCFSSTHLSVHKHYDGKNRTFDVGIVTLNTDSAITSFIDSNIGYAAYGVEDSDNMLGSSLNVTGYPGEQDSLMFSMAGKVTDLNKTNNRLYYDIDTSPGQSGSGVYELKKSVPHLKSVHTHGISNSCFSTKKEPHFKWNSGTLLHNDILEFVDSIANGTA